MFVCFLSLFLSTETALADDDGARGNIGQLTACPGNQLPDFGNEKKKILKAWLRLGCDPWADPRFLSEQAGRSCE